MKHQKCLKKFRIIFFYGHLFEGQNVHALVSRVHTARCADKPKAKNVSFYELVIPYIPKKKANTNVF